MMHEIKFSSAKLAIGLVLSIVAVPLAVAMLGSDRGKVQFAAWVLLVLCPMFTLICIRWLLSSRPAIAFDAHKLMVTTLWRSHVMRWSDVVEIGTGNLSTYAAYGMVKTSSQNDLNIVVRKGTSRVKKIRVPLMFMSLPNGINGLLDDLERASQGAMPSTAPIAAPRQPDPQSGNFDADAAFARYMAAQNQAAPSPAMPRPGGFGRKGLS
jgi:hypothetical protein